MRSSLPSAFSLSSRARERTLELLLDVFGCAIESARHAPRVELANHESGVDGDSLIWLDGRRTEPSHAALVNGTRAHFAELDDGNPRASLHGGVSVIPAAIAVAESTEASGRALIEAIAFGYAAAVAYGRPLLAGIEDERAHPPSRVGCLGAAAAAARLLELDDDGVSGAIDLAGVLMPFGPFESFTRGADVKDLYGGYPAFVGIQAALSSRSGIRGPGTLFEPAPLDVDEVLHVAVKPWPSCRATHAALTAIESLRPFDAPVDAVRVETYPFASELTHDADPSTPIGRKASIPHAIEAAFPEVTADSVEVETARDQIPSGARVTVQLANGDEVTATTERPRVEPDVRAKFRRYAGERASDIEAAVDDLASAPHVRALTATLSSP